MKKIKKWTTTLGAVTMLISTFTFTTLTEEVQASGFEYFHTSDGKYDGTVTTTSSKPNVWIQLDPDRLYYKPSSTSASRLTNHSNVSVRLCSKNTRSCTPYKGFWKKNFDSLPTSGFINMIPGTYYLDIKNDYSSGYIYGYVSYDPTDLIPW